MICHVGALLLNALLMCLGGQSAKSSHWIWTLSSSLSSPCQSFMLTLCLQVNLHTIATRALSYMCHTLPPCASCAVCHLLHSYAVSLHSQIPLLHVASSQCAFNHNCVLKASCVGPVSCCTAVGMGCGVHYNCWQLGTQTVQLFFTQVLKSMHACCRWPVQLDDGAPAGGHICAHSSAVWVCTWQSGARCGQCSQQNRSSGEFPV